jgi:hypothetical protein
MRLKNQKKKQMDPSFRWDDEVGGFRQNDEFGKLSSERKEKREKTGTGSRPSPR